MTFKCPPDVLGLQLRDVDDIKDIQTLGRCAWGSWQHQFENLAAFRNDLRWESTLVLRRTATSLSAIALHQARDTTTAESFLGAGVARRAMPTLFIGGPARLTGGAAVKAGGSPYDHGHSLRALLDGVRAVVGADRGKVHVAALGLPESQLPYFAAFLEAPQVSFSAVRSYIDVGRAASVADFIAGQRTTVRKHWTADIRRVSQAGFTVDTCAAKVDDAVLVDTLAGLVSAVERRNGMPGLVPLIRLRLARWLSSGASLCFSARNGGEYVGMALARVDGDRLIVGDIGMSDAVPFRHSLYIELLFGAPLRFAISSGLRALELGVGHDAVKRNRGATQDALWDVLGWL